MWFSDSILVPCQLDRIRSVVRGQIVQALFDLAVSSQNVDSLEVYFFCSPEKFKLSQVHHCEF